MDREVTAKSLVNEMSKGTSGDRKLQEAAEKMKEADIRLEEAKKTSESAQQGIQLMELLATSQNDDDDGDKAFREIGAMAGYDEAVIEKRLQAARAEQRGERPPEDNTSSSSNGSAAAASGDMTKEQQDRLDQVHADAVKRAEKDAVAQFRDAIDKDDKLGKLNDKQKDLLVSKMLRPAVESGLRQGSKFGPELIREALEKTRQDAEGFGILPGEDEETKSRLGEIEQAGVNLGPSDQSALMDSIRKGEVPERVSAADPNYMDNFVTRGLAEARRSSGKEESGKSPR